jgi:polysaccharide export outer membrane protein
LPLADEVNVGGKTTKEAEALIAAKYSEHYLVNPRVSIAVSNYRPFFIVGEVKNPGSYPYVAGMTVLNAVALAGGYTPRADHGDIAIKRAADTSAPEAAIGEFGPVMPGDIVRVKGRFF